MMELRIKEICKEKEISLAELGRMINVSRSTMNSILKGNPTKSTLENIANALNISFFDLFKIEDQEECKINGFVEIDGIVSRIKTKEDILKLVEKLSQ